MQLNDSNWKIIRKLFQDAQMSSLHYAIATVNKDGTPHVSPIGSLFLRDDMSGFYFEELAGSLPGNLQSNGAVCVMAVNSSFWFWIKALIRGRFASLPSVRLNGRAGEKREATPEEIARMHRFIQPFRFFKGHDILWSRMAHVRDIDFYSCENINANEMTYKLD